MAIFLLLVFYLHVRYGKAKGPKDASMRAEKEEAEATALLRWRHLLVLDVDVCRGRSCTSRFGNRGRPMTSGPALYSSIIIIVIALASIALDRPSFASSRSSSFRHAVVAVVMKMMIVLVRGRSSSLPFALDIEGGIWRSPLALLLRLVLRLRFARAFRGWLLRRRHRFPAAPPTAAALPPDQAARSGVARREALAVAVAVGPRAHAPAEAAPIFVAVAVAPGFARCAGPPRQLAVVVVLLPVRVPLVELAPTEDVTEPGAAPTDDLVEEMDGGGDQHDEEELLGAVLINFAAYLLDLALAFRRETGVQHLGGFAQLLPPRLDDLGVLFPLRSMKPHVREWRDDD